MEQQDKKQIVAVCQRRRHKKSTAADWQAFLREKVPQYMMPSHWLEIDQFPVNKNGKIDRKQVSRLCTERIPLGSL